MLAACGSGGDEYAVRLEVQDGWIRAIGDECAGSIPYLYVHATGPYRIESAEGGEVVADGELPPGTAVEAFNEDLGAPKVPTFCRFELTPSLPEAGDYRLVLARGEPLPFTVGRGRVLVTIP